MRLSCTGYRLEVVKNSEETILYSRRRNILNKKFSYIADALKKLPDGTIVDGELVAVDAAGRSDFNQLQNFRSAGLHENGKPPGGQRPLGTYELFSLYYELLHNIGVPDVGQG